jgi:hypothetical protein
MTTRCAGRFTPHANVLVQTNICYINRLQVMKPYMIEGMAHFLPTSSGKTPHNIAEFDKVMTPN